MRRNTRNAVEHDPAYLQISELYRRFSPGRFGSARAEAVRITNDLDEFLKCQLSQFFGLQGSLRIVAAGLLLDPFLGDYINQIVANSGLTAQVLALPWVLVSYYIFYYFTSLTTPPDNH